MDGFVSITKSSVQPVKKNVNTVQHEVILQFHNSHGLDNFRSILDELFFVMGVAKVLKRNALLVRTYIPQSQLSSMLAFF